MRRRAAGRAVGATRDQLNETRADSGINQDLPVRCIQFDTAARAGDRFAWDGVQQVTTPRALNVKVGAAGKRDPGSISFSTKSRAASAPAIRSGGAWRSSR